MALPRAYRSFADFERQEIRPSLRLGWSTDEIQSPHEAELEFDLDPFETALQAAEDEDEDQDLED